MSEANAVQGDGNEQGTGEEQTPAIPLRLIRQEDEAAEGTVEGAPADFSVDPPEEPDEIPEHAFGVLAVVTVPVQAEILLNDQPIGVAPLQVRVLPGEYAMKVRYLGRLLYECDITIVEGQATSVPLDFSEPAPSAAASPAPRPAPTRPPQRRPMFGYGMLGLLGVAVAVGGFVAMRSSGEEEPAPPTELPPTPPPQQLVRRRRRRRFVEPAPEASGGQAATPAAAPAPSGDAK